MAQSNEAKRFFNNDLGGGLNNVNYATQLADNQLFYARNFRYNFSNFRNPNVREGVKKWNTSTTFQLPPRSMAYYPGNPGRLLVTSYQDVYVQDTDLDTKTYTKVTGALSLSGDTRWTWVPYTNYLGTQYLFGTNGQTHMCYFDGTTLTEYVGANSPDNVKYGAVLARRFFSVGSTGASDYATLFWSNAGGYSYNTTTDDNTNWGYKIINEGGPITGLAVFRKKLVIFKENMIWTLTTGTPDTDETKWNFEPFVYGVGCVDPWSIQTIPGDVLFASGGGSLISLHTVLNYGDFSTASVNDTYSLPGTMEPDGTSDLATVHSIQYQQYLASCRSVSSLPINDKCLVGHYHNKRVSGDQLIWTEYTGKMCFSAAVHTQETGGGPSLFIGAPVAFSPITIGTATAVVDGAGALAADTYYFIVTAVDGNGGETIASAEVSAVVGGGGTNAVDVTWTNFAGADHYNIYMGNTSGVYTLYTTDNGTPYRWKTNAGKTATSGPVTTNTAYYGEVYRYGWTYTDDGENYIKQLRTRSFTFGSEYLLKKLVGWRMSIAQLGAMTVNWVVRLLFNDWQSENFPFQLTTEWGAQWDVGTYDSSRYSTAVDSPSPMAPQTHRIGGRAAGERGKLFNSIALELFTADEVDGADLLAFEILFREMGKEDGFNE